MTTHSLTITIVPDPTAGTIAPEVGYWLTIEQIVRDERITTGQAADMIDALFDLTPCKDPVESGTEPAEEPPADMAEALDKIAEKVPVDLTACERRLTGTYQTDLKIVRSHPDIPYTLRLSVGDILETVLVESQVAENLDVKAATSVTLSMPVQSGLACTWLGTVIGPKGPIDPPTIKAAGNTLFWAGEATGTIRAEYGSIHDVVTVEIPGVPYYVGTDRGEPQDSTALAFYHYQVFPCDISPPVEEDEATLAEVCGWSGNLWDVGDEDNPEIPEPPPPEPVYGCIDYYPLAPFGSPVTEPWFYEQTCCVPGSHDGCRTRTSRIEGGKGLSEATIARMTAEWPGPIEFIGLGPITPEGCGTRYEETKIIQHNCCDEVEPMAWNSDVSVEVLAPSTSGIVGVTGGAPPYHWSIRGNGFALSADGRLRDGVSDSPHIYIYALATACGYAPIEVTDGCSVVNDGVRSTEGEWVQIRFGDELLPCIITGDISNLVGNNTTYADFLVIEGKYKFRQETYTDYSSSQCAGHDLNICYQPFYTFDPTVAIHYSCISAFYNAIPVNSTNVGGWHYISDRCFYENFYIGGYACTQTRSATHYKTVYEWRC